MPRNAAWLILAPLCLGATAPVGTKSITGVDQPILQTQVILDHLGFAPGVLDGKRGQSLTAALKGFQEARGLPITGKLDAATQAQLDRYRGWSATRTLRLSKDSLAGPFINPLPSKPADQARLPALAYRSKMEKLAEMFHTTPATLIALNSPDTSLAPGTPVVFPTALPTIIWSRNSRRRWAASMIRCRSGGGRSRVSPTTRPSTTTPNCSGMRRRATRPRPCRPGRPGRTGCFG